MSRLSVRMFLDNLASRVLPSVTPFAPPAGPEVAAGAAHTAPAWEGHDYGHAPRMHAAHLAGEGGGYTADGPHLADGLREYRLHGWADLAGPGKVSVHGTVLAGDGHPHDPVAGVLTFRDGRGSITVEFDRAAGAKDARYHVLDGTGAYRHDDGAGELRLRLDPGAVHLKDGASGMFELAIGRTHEGGWHRHEGGAHHDGGMPTWPGTPHAA